MSEFNSNNNSNKEKEKSLLPVLVWIHGGGLCVGASSTAWQFGSELLRHGDVVLVNFNYRLGALGFMVSDESTRGGLPESEFIGVC